MKLVEVICKELGVEVGEEWVGTDNGLYKFDNHGNLLKYYKQHNNWYKEQYLASKIISGELKPMWKPRVGERYWTVEFGEDDSIDVYSWASTYGSQQLLAKGLVFKTKEEAIEAANKMLNALKGED